MKLLSSFKMSIFNLSNRVVMCPMTRCKTTQPGDIPNDLMAHYYSQRSSAGLIITEATQISQQGQGYSFTPGIYSKEQINGWKKITHAVHSNGGKIFLQLWHVGRMSHESFHNGQKPVAPSSIAPDASVWVFDEEKKEGIMKKCPIPRELSIIEIKDIVEQFRNAARNSLEAGFDGVEIHGANGYLIEQFLRSSSNKRNDEYGYDPMENRFRFVMDVVKAVTDEVGPDKTGIRISPFITQRGMNDPNMINTILHLAEKLNDINIAYIHLAEADWDDSPNVPEDFRKKLRKKYTGAIIVAGKYTKERAEDILNKNLADLVGFGRLFIKNPDLVERFKNNNDLRKLTDEETRNLFGGKEKGYTDYPNYNGIVE